MAFRAEDGFVRARRPTEENMPLPPAYVPEVLALELSNGFAGYLNSAEGVTPLGTS
jgi:hypothetical protein